MEELLGEAKRLGVAVRWKKLPGDIAGYYDPAADEIRLDKRLTLAQRRSTLAHELGHAYYRHDCSNQRNEAQAWRRGALLAVNPDDYMTATTTCESSDTIAAELDLTPAIIQAWERWWLPRLMAAPAFIARYPQTVTLAYNPT